MANPTTNYGWPMPLTTDLVTGLPAQFAAFGQPVDTSLKALNPETTLGDISYRSATSNTNTRLGIGSTSQVLTVAGGVPTWATPAVSASAMTLIKARTSFSNVASTTTSFDNVFSNTYQNYLIVIDGWTAITAGSTILWQFRSGGTTDSNAAYAAGYSNVTWAGGSAPVGPGYGTTSIGMTTAAGAGNFAGLNINYYASRAADTNAKIAYTGYSPQLQGFTFGAGFSNTSTNYDGFILSQSSGNIYTGAVTVYGLAKS